MIEDGFDERTLANMNVALERACTQLPTGKDNHAARKFIAGKIIACAKSGKLTLTDLTTAGQKALLELTTPSKK